MDKLKFRIDIVVAWVAIIAFAAVTGAFVWKASSAVLFADDWYYLDKVIYPLMHGQFEWRDLFIKRGAADNAQPLNRLILIAHTELFHMDYAVQGLIGVFFALLCVVYLWSINKKFTFSKGRFDLASLLFISGLGALLLSLNATNIYTWPLVTTLMFVGLLGLIVLFHFTYRILNLNGGYIRKFALLVALVFVWLIAFDTFATIAVLAIFLLLAVNGLGARDAKRLSVSFAPLLALFLYGRLYAYIFSVQSQPLSLTRVSHALSFLITNWKAAWKLLVVPLVSPYYYPTHFAGTVWVAFAAGAVVCLLVQAWFWLSYFKTEASEVRFVSACLMLYSYGTIAGIVVGRVPQFGIDYIEQPRYVAFYLIQIIAILLMAFSIIRDEPETTQSVGGKKLASAIMMANALFFIVTFMPYARSAWAIIPYVHRYQQAEINKIVEIYEDPGKIPPRCNTNSITICGWPKSDRAKLTNLLAEYKLNMFNAEFRRRHDFSIQAAAKKTGK